MWPGADGKGISEGVGLYQWPGWGEGELWFKSTGIRTMIFLRLNEAEQFETHILPVIHMRGEDICVAALS